MKELKPIDRVRIGEFVSISDLIAAKGKFYNLFGEPNQPCCDLPTMTFRLENLSDSGYKRIE